MRSFDIEGYTPHHSTTPPPHLAQWFYPEGDRSIVQVIGIGQVSQPADRAFLSLPFAPIYEADPPPDGVLSQFGWEEPEPLTLEELQPIVEALIASGLEASAVESKIVPPQSGALPFPFPSGSSPGGALVIVTLDDPQIATLDQIVETTQGTVEESDRLDFGSPQVQLELDSCSQLEQNAYQAAVASAQERAEAIATALDVRLSTPAISEPFYSPLLSGCYNDSLFVFGEGDEPYEPGMDLSIELIKQLFFSYPIESY
ncbi:MAG: SIMPL domain-containing protein [Merismopedia sp. SIO2A8]|nr:SIMPL domain-containing protein [Merismopedia sp. SIO2A8]